MKILMFNQQWFAEHWRAAGHTVVTAGPHDEFNVVIPYPLAPLEEVLNRCEAGFSPDVIIVHDNSAPFLVSNFENTDIPCVFFSVDSHHHTPVHKYFGSVFDRVYVAQRDYIPEFEAEGVAPEWLPLWAPRAVEASDRKEYGAVFVGTMDERLNPERVAFFRALGERVPITIKRGAYWEIFPHAEIVVNQTVKGDLNFRVFEAMMCGSLLLTEESGNGLTDLFRPGEHLITYPKNGVEDAATLISNLLADPQRCRRIGAAGRDEVVAKHTEAHRADKVMEDLRGLQRSRAPRRYLGALVNYTVASAGFDRVDSRISLHGLARGLSALDAALTAAEPMNPDIGCYAALAAIRYDQLVPGSTGFDLLRRAAEAHPDVAVLRFGLIRELLNRGARAEAEEEARRISQAPPGELFATAEKVIGSLLDKFTK